MIAIEDSEYTRFLRRLASLFGKPRAIVIFSAHWESALQKVSHPRMQHSVLYDFRGFPDALYQIQYRAIGDRVVERQIQGLLEEAGVGVETDDTRGLDHGVWTILSRIYPDADIPIIAMSVNPQWSPRQQFDVGRALSGLRRQDVFFIGSGVTVHNFKLFALQDNTVITEAAR